MIRGKTFSARLSRGAQYFYAVLIGIFCVFPFLWIPAILLFVLVQKQFIDSMAGSVKG